MIKNHFTVDVEEWHHRTAFQDIIRRNNIKTPNSALEGTRIILDLLDKYNAKATFFVLGDVAQHSPETIGVIHERGHEIASHGYSHKKLDLLDETEFEEELTKTEKAIKKITGEKPIGFRAPKFSLNKKTSWAVDVLEKHGYVYDSSVLPADLLFYRNRGTLAMPHKINCHGYLEKGNSNLWEFPILANDIFGLKIPVKRQLGTNFALNSIRKLNQKKIPATFLVHSWEVIPTPKIVNKVRIPFHKRIIRNTRIPCSKRIDKILRTFRFTSIKEAIRQV